MAICTRTSPDAGRREGGDVPVEVPRDVPGNVPHDVPCAVSCEVPGDVPGACEQNGGALAFPWDGDSTDSDTGSDTSSTDEAARKAMDLMAVPAPLGNVSVESSSSVRIGGTHIHVASGSRVTLAFPVSHGSVPALAPPPAAATAATATVEDKPREHLDVSENNCPPVTGSEQKQPGKKLFLHRFRYKIASTVALLVLCSTVVLCLKVPEWISGDGEGEGQGRPTDAVTHRAVTTTTAPNTFDPSPSPSPSPSFVVPRARWGAAAPVRQPAPLQRPVTYVLGVSVDDKKYRCKSEPNCSKVMREIQRSHMYDLTDYYDIAYNFVVGLDESVFEGRGWDSQACLGDAYGYNAISVGVIAGLAPDYWFKRSSITRLVALGTSLGVLKDVVFLDKWTQLVDPDKREVRGREGRGTCKW